MHSNVEWEEVSDIWYFRNPLDYKSVRLPTEDRAVVSLEARLPDGFPHWTAYLAGKDLDRREQQKKWEGLLAEMPRAAAISYPSMERAEHSLLACSHDYFGKVSEVNKRDLLPFRLSEEGVAQLQHFFNQRSIYADEIMIPYWGKFCKQVYPDSAPSKEEAMNVARLNAIYPFFKPVTGTFVAESFGIPLEMNPRPAAEEAFKRFKENPEAHLAEYSGSPEAKRVKWLRDWMEQQGIPVNREYFSKLLEFGESVDWDIPRRLIY